MIIYQYEKLESVNPSLISRIELTFWNQITKHEKARLIGAKISLCKNLKYLSLGFSLLIKTIKMSGNQMRDDGIIALSQEISKCENLNHLRIILIANSIGSRGLEIFGKQIQSLFHLKSLYLLLQNNYLEEKDIIDLAKSLKQFQFLETLLLNCTFIQNNSGNIEDIGNEFKDYQRMKNLTINFPYLKIENNKKIELFKNFTLCSQLESLSLALIDSNIDDELLQQFAIYLGQLSNIQQLDLNFNQNPIHNKGLKSLITQLQQIALLKLNLKFADCQIGDDIQINFLEDLKNYESLESLHLNLENNLLTDNLMDISSQVFVKCQKLKSIEIYFKQNEQITSQGVNQLIKTFNQIQQLKELRLELGNQGVFELDYIFFLKIITSCPLLQVLQLTRCYGFENEAVYCLGQLLPSCQSLQYLNLTCEIGFLTANDSILQLQQGISNCPKLRKFEVLFIRKGIDDPNKIIQLQRITQMFRKIRQLVQFYSYIF